MTLLDPVDVNKSKGRKKNKVRLSIFILEFLISLHLYVLLRQCSYFHSGEQNVTIQQLQVFNLIWVVLSMFSFRVMLNRAVF